MEGALGRLLLALLLEPLLAHLARARVRVKVRVRARLSVGLRVSWIHTGCRLRPSLTTLTPVLTGWWPLLARLLDEGVALDAAQREGPRRGGGPLRVRALRPRAHLVRVRVRVRVRVSQVLCGRGLTRLGEKVGIGRARKAANSGAGGSAGSLRGSARPRPGDFGRVGLRGVTWPRVRVRVRVRRDLAEGSG